MNRYNKDVLISVINGQLKQEHAVNRRTGITTSAVLQTIGLAIDCPGKSLVIVDNSTDSSKRDQVDFVAKMARAIVEALGLKDIEVKLVPGRETSHVTITCNFVLML